MNIQSMEPSSLDTSSDPRWRAIVAHSRASDGEFIYSVKTTGVYCRPSCSSRRAKPENVQFHASIIEAERAGFRACKRCRPNDTALDELRVVKVAKACRLMDSAETPPSLKGLAKAVNLSPFHFHRIFKAATGITPKQYAAAKRAEKLKSGLSAGARVTEAILDAGYNSNSRFYAESNAILGMTASAFRRQGAREQIRFAIGQSSLGAILVAMSLKGICCILLGDDADQLVRDFQDRFENAQLIGADVQFESIVAKVVGNVDVPGQELNLPLDVRGTAFQQKVWKALSEIPAGSTASYQAVAAAIGVPKAARAVAQACAANPLAVAIPCHRVVRNDGSMSGYRWGIERKRVLLSREGALAA